MTNIKEENGGYYAIKGFEFQIDKAILELLSSTDENKSIRIENIQDIDTNDFVIQVKYKEAAKFTPSAITKPVIQLINEFLNERTKKYYLFAYFGDLNGYDSVVSSDKKISKETLNNILGNQSSNFSENDKIAFVENFDLDFAPTFQAQFNQVLLELKKLDFIGNDDDEAIFYYANIADYLRKVVVNNKEDLNKRSCTKKRIIDYLKNGRKLLFDSSFRDYKGEQAYFKFIKTKYFSSRNIDNFERFIIIETSPHNSIADIKDVSLKLKGKFFIINNRGIKSGAPYIYFRKESDANLKQLKTELLSEGIIFKDGHDFLNAEFSLKILKEPSTEQNGISLKFLNTQENLEQMINESLNKTKEIYQFFVNEPLEIQNDLKHIKIQIKSLSDISSII